jgi:hypothetical protein
MGLLHSFQENPCTQFFAASPLLSTVLAVLVTCVVTRIVTGLHSSVADNNHDTASKTPNTIAYWLPWIGTAFSFLGNIESTITQDR